ncbi:1-deoxy-D-xylulose-5-phosphate synthase N-terminal domain-containing protein, partial [Streptomyces zagrosensis]
MTLRPDGPARPAATPLLDTLAGPDTLRAVPVSRLLALAAEIRVCMRQAVSRPAGQLGPELGVVELTIALHRVFDSPRDRLLWDTGQRSYAHKLLTGCRDAARARSRGPTGELARQAAPYDVIETAHAGTALSYADGFAKAHRLRGLRDRYVVAVVGSEALVGGMAWEALNNIAAARDLPLVIVLHDHVPGHEAPNGGTPSDGALDGGTPSDGTPSGGARSDGATGGGLAQHLATLRARRQSGAVSFERAPKPAGDARHGILSTSGPSVVISQTGVLVQTPHAPAMATGDRGVGSVGSPAPTATRAHDTLRARSLFDDLGFAYVGPVDGHDVVAVESALRRAKAFGGPAIVHCVTRQPPADGADPTADTAAGTAAGTTGTSAAGHLPAVSPADPALGPSWTSVFSDEMVRVGAEREDVVGITAAMLQ